MSKSLQWRKTWQKRRRGLKLSSNISNRFACCEYCHSNLTLKNTTCQPMSAGCPDIHSRFFPEVSIRNLRAQPLPDLLFQDHSPKGSQTLGQPDHWTVSPPLRLMSVSVSTCIYLISRNNLVVTPLMMLNGLRLMFSTKVTKPQKDLVDVSLSQTAPCFEAPCAASVPWQNHQKAAKQGSLYYQLKLQDQI